MGLALARPSATRLLALPLATAAGTRLGQSAPSTGAKIGSRAAVASQRLRMSPRLTLMPLPGWWQVAQLRPLLPSAAKKGWLPMSMGPPVWNQPTAPCPLAMVPACGSVPMKAGVAVALERGASSAERKLGPNPSGRLRATRSAVASAGPAAKAPSVPRPTMRRPAASQAERLDSCRKAPLPLLCSRGRR